MEGMSDCEHVKAFEAVMLAAATQLGIKCMTCEKKATCDFPQFMAQGIDAAKNWLKGQGKVI